MKIMQTFICMALIMMIVSSLIIEAVFCLIDEAHINRIQFYDYLENYYISRHVYHVYSGNQVDHNHRIECKLLSKSQWTYCSSVHISNIDSISCATSQKPVLVITTSHLLDISKMSWELLSRFHWFLPTITLINDDFINVSIPYDTKFLVLLPNNAAFSVYNLNKKEPAQIEPFFPSKNFFEARRNFQGAELVYVASTIDPCSNTSMLNNFGRHRLVECIQYNIWMDIVVALNASTRAIRRTDRTIHSLVKLFKEAVASTDIVQFNSENAKHMYFFWPLTVFKFELFTKYSGFDLSLDRYLRPLDATLWFGILGCITFCSIINVFAYGLAVKYLNNRKQVPGKWQHAWTPLVTFSYQSDHLPAILMWERLLLFICLLTPAVIIPAYNAILTSFLMLDLPSKPITSVEDFIIRPEYKLVYRKYKVYNFHEMLNKDSNGSFNKYLHDKVLVSYETLPENDTAGSLMMCREKITFISTIMSLRASKPPCKYYKTANPFYKSFGSMVMAWRSPYNTIFNIFMKRLRYSGIYWHMREEVMLPFVPRLLNNAKIRKSPYNPILIKNVIFLHLILIGGIVISCIFLMFEFIINMILK